jgi:hypothetical protein
MRLFRDGKVIFEGKPQSVNGTPDPKTKAINVFGALMLGNEMEPGDYVLQVIVTDKLRKPKENNASQFVQFEIVE